MWSSLVMKKAKIGKADILIDKLPLKLTPVIGSQQFDDLWNLHPDDFSKIKMYDKEVPIPRWQQAYGKDYYFSNQISEALSIPDLLQPYLDWSKQFNSAYNGLLLNWYDSDLKHYIGKHRDSEVGLVNGSHIITISIGADRLLRMREVGQKGFDDLLIGNGDVVVIPWSTNKKFTHEIPYLSRYPGKRISITIRAFK